MAVTSGATDKVSVRPAAPADMPAVGRLGALLVAQHHDFDPDRFIPATGATAAGYGGYLDSQRARPNVVILVADSGGDVVGYTYAGLEGTDYMSLRGPAGVLYDLFVDPARRREGIGRLLLEATAAELAARGAPRLVLSTAERNDLAQRLFASAGFRRTMIEMTRELRADPG